LSFAEGKRSDRLLSQKKAQLGTLATVRDSVIDKGKTSHSKSALSQI
jgi:hypothetical protein